MVHSLLDYKYTTDNGFVSLPPLRFNINRSRTSGRCCRIPIHRIPRPSSCVLYIPKRSSNCDFSWAGRARYYSVTDGDSATFGRRLWDSSYRITQSNGSFRGGVVPRLQYSKQQATMRMPAAGLQYGALGTQL
jgi:hypothetical protein